MSMRGVSDCAVSFLQWTIHLIFSHFCCRCYFCPCWLCRSPLGTHCPLRATSRPHSIRYLLVHDLIMDVRTCWTIWSFSLQ
ncbi:hypothetical protein BC826DRAFT_1015071 [Russula brevipes]|nr:hypothetical protein BC826DRAFT_1015071 [Russula brevipes]